MILLNGREVKVERYPNGEIKMPKVFDNAENKFHKFNGTIMYIKKEFRDELQIGGKYDHICLKFENETDLIVLMFLKKYLDESIYRDSIKTLLIPYLPYSRMDRVHSDYELFTLRYFCEFINSLHFDFVEVYEPHSDVCMALLNNVRKFDCTKFMFDEIFKKGEKENSLDKDNVVVCFPDAGAQKRYEIIEKEGFKTIVGFKTRNWETGRIEKLDLFGADVKDKVVYILDDLCSYGGTFLLTAEKLKELGAKEVKLIVTHCEKSILKGEIFKNDLIDKVYCTDSIISKFDIQYDNVSDDKNFYKKVHEKIVIKEIIQNVKNKSNVID